MAKKREPGRNTAKRPDDKRRKPGAPGSKEAKAARRNNRRAAEILREERRAKVAALYARGRTFPEIAKRLDVAYRTIQNDMEVIRKRWRETYVSEFARGLVDELGKLEAVWSEAWIAWRRSQKHTVTSEQGSNDKGSWDKQKQVTNAGDPRFLGILTQISKQRMEALGMVFAAKQKQQEARGKYGQGYEVLTVVVRDRAQAQQAMTLPEFRHQFVGYDADADEHNKSTSELIQQQVEVLEGQVVDSQGNGHKGNGNGEPSDGR